MVNWALRHPGERALLQANAMYYSRYRLPFFSSFMFRRSAGASYPGLGAELVREPKDHSLAHKKCPFLSPTPFPILTSFPFNFIQQWVVSSPWLNNRFPRNPSGGPTTYRTSRARSPSSPVSWRMLDVGRESVKAKHPIFGRRECGRRERNREGAFVSLLPVDPPCSPRRVVDKD